MKIVSHGVETAAAAFSIGACSLAGFVTVASMQTAAAFGAWESVTIAEHVGGAIGGLLGGLAYANLRKMNAPLSIVMSLVLNVAWCAFLAPLVTHLLAVLYPQLRLMLIEPLVALAVGAVISAFGMVVYEGLIAMLDVVKRVLPDKVDDIIEWVFGKIGKKDSGDKPDKP